MNKKKIIKLKEILKKQIKLESGTSHLFEKKSIICTKS